MTIQSDNEEQTMYSNQLTAAASADYLLREEGTAARDYVGFWYRLISYVIDIVIVFSIKGIILSPLKFINQGMPVEIGYWTLTGVLGMTVFYLYFLVMTKVFRQTVGKMIVGLKVEKQDGSALTWNDLFFREVIGRFLHNVLFILKVLYLVVAFTKEKQGIHDMIGNTVVVKVK